MLYEELCMQIEAVFHTEARDEAVVGREKCATFNFLQGHPTRI